MAPQGNTHISASVGRNGVNDRNDVVTVQKLINDHLPEALSPLAVDGECGRLTIEAIEDIQSQFLRMSRPDGRVDPDGETLRFLTGGSIPSKPHPGSGTLPADVIAAAQAAHLKWKIPAAVTLAQWALESGWGRHMPQDSNNPFGIKAAPGQPFVEAETREVIHGQTVKVVARFRKFASMNEAFDQHGELLATGRPYANARTVENDANAFADALTGVYATDPGYGSLLKRLMQSHNLYQYD